MRRVCASVGLSALLLLCACAGRAAEDIAPLAQSAGLTERIVQTDTHKTYTLARARDPAAPWVVYIEGDGYAWVTPTQPSLDPTPRKALGLRLAVLDPSPNLLYLARPCQFVTEDPACHVEDWTQGRFSEKIVRNLNQAIDQTIAAPSSGLHLVGYSGGGAIAALLAARRQDVLSLRTMAGLLDHEKATALHEASPLSGSLNPADFASALKTLPQIHYVGGKDRVVPPSIADAFAQKMGQSLCITIALEATAAHEEGWLELWRSRADVHPVCKTP